MNDLEACVGGTCDRNGSVPGEFGQVNWCQELWRRYEWGGSVGVGSAAYAPGQG